MTEALVVILCSSQAGSPGFGRLGGNPMIEAFLLIFNRQLSRLGRKAGRHRVYILTVCNYSARNTHKQQ